jgi:hypothetical protein
MADIEGDKVAEPRHLPPAQGSRPRPSRRRLVTCLLAFCLGLAAMIALHAVARADPPERAPMTTVPDVAAVTRKAEAGDARSQQLLGAWYGGTTFLARDDARSLYWFTRAAEQGDFASQQALGAAYEWGVHVPKDLALSAFWYGKAANQLRAMAERGSLRGEYGLGLYYAEGHGGPRDIAKALFWLRAALKQQVDDRKTPESIYSEMQRLIEQLEGEERAAQARPSNTKD